MMIYNSNNIPAIHTYKDAVRYGARVLKQADIDNPDYDALELFLYVTGIDRTTISAYELAKREPSVSNLISLANYYKVTLDFLCGRNQRMIIDITDLDELSKIKSKVDRLLCLL